ncbi:MAG: URC4/urg3 family protein [Rhodopila sp.]
MNAGPASVTPAELTYLRTPAAIRDRARVMTEHVEAGRSQWFALDSGGLDRAVEATLEVTRQRFPDPATIPFHARWRHFEAGGRDRWASLLPRLRHLPKDEIARRQMDLAVVSVLLDAGAGPDWRYREPGTDETYRRSEGLGVASFHMFASGLFSRDARTDPLRVDAERLAGLTAMEIATGFQVTADNRMIGLEGRAGLLRALGAVPLIRPGGLFDVIVQRNDTVRASAILAAVLDVLSPIWPAPMGDIWHHPAAGWVPFHKLSQWLSYSLVEPLQSAGLAVVELDSLTGLPEYRNGGLLIDTGALRVKDRALLQTSFAAGDEPIVEWRALTITLLDRIAEQIRRRLGLNAEALPLVKILEGGTWFAGRRLANERRPGAQPPIAVRSDGTVF